MSRSTLFNCVGLLLLLAAAGMAQPPAKTTVTVRQLSDDPQHVKVVEVELSKKHEPGLSVHYKLRNGTKGSYGKFAENTISSMPSGVGRLERRYEGDVAKYRLFILHDDTATYELIIGDDLFTVKGAAAPVGAVAATPAPPPIAWHTFHASDATTWTADAKRRALQASVRVITPSGSGGGTIVVPPPEVEALLREGEVLVYGAEHVTPDFLKAAPFAVDVFDYDSSLSPGAYIRHPARLLCAQKHGEADVACLAFVPDKRCTISKAPVAGEKRWFSRKIQYLRVGCRDGKPPHHEHTYAVQGVRDDRGGYVSVDVRSSPGDSGGGLFDPDGYLMGICSASGEKSSSLIIGEGLLDVSERTQGTAQTSTFVYSFNAVKLAAAAELTAREDARWATIRLPLLHPKYGASEKVDEGLSDAARLIEQSIEQLPSAEREEVRKKFAEALGAYEKALKSR